MNSNKLYSPRKNDLNENNLNFLNEEASNYLDEEDDYIQNSNYMNPNYIGIYLFKLITLF